MPYTAEEVAELVEQEDVECIRLAFFDALGHPKSLFLSPSVLPRALAGGVPMEEFSADAAPGELLLFPQLHTLQGLDWYREGEKTARLYCSIRHRSGAPFAADSRYILQRAEQAARDMGFSLTADGIQEFYLLPADAGGRPGRVPQDGAQAWDAPPADKGAGLREEVCRMLQDVGIRPLFHCHGGGAGQHRIVCRPAGPVEAADNAMTFREAVYTAAHHSGLYASFAPKPLIRQRGSGFFIRISLGRAGGRYMEAFFAGVIRHIRDMTAFLNPVRPSYERLGEIRNEKLCTWTGEGALPYVELRSPDSAANPYIAFALLIYAGLDGIRKGLMQGERQAPYFPKTVEEAHHFARESDFIRDVLPAQVIEAYRQSVL